MLSGLILNINCQQFARDFWTIKNVINKNVILVITIEHFFLYAEIY